MYESQSVTVISINNFNPPNSVSNFKIQKSKFNDWTLSIDHETENDKGLKQTSRKDNRDLDKAIM